MNNDTAFNFRVPDEITELDDGELQDKQQTLVAHENEGTLTEEQQRCLNDIRNEIYKRASVGGPYSDYEGGSGDE